MLRLRQEIRRNKGRVCAGVCNDEDLRGARRHVDGHHSLTVLQQHLRRRDVLVAGTQQLVYLHEQNILLENGRVRYLATSEWLQ